MKAVIPPVLGYVVVVIQHSGTDGTILLRFNLAETHHLAEVKDDFVA